MQIANNGEGITVILLNKFKVGDSVLLRITGLSPTSLVTMQETPKLKTGRWNKKKSAESNMKTADSPNDTEGKYHLFQVKFTNL